MHHAFQVRNFVQKNIMLSILQTQNMHTQDWVLPTMLKHTLRGHGAGVYCVAVSGDSKRITSGIGHGSKIKLWCADTGELVCTFEGHVGCVCSLDFKGQSTLVSGGGDNLIKVRALSDGDAPALLHTMRGHTGLVWVWAVKVYNEGAYRSSV
jgi:WD40 repeat protein